jgi:carbonic anhydrase
MHRLVNGVLSFQRDVVASNREQFEQLQDKQTPFALFIACSDSRVAPEILTQREPGDIFVVRNAGNIIPSYGPAAGGVSASIEYAVAVLGITNIVVCGHSNCGAMKAVLQDDKLDNLPAVASWIKHAAAAKEIVNTVMPDASPEERLNAVVHENVLCQLRNLQTHPVIAAGVATNRLRLFGWVYNIETGSVDTFDAASGQFVPLTQGLTVDATPPRQFPYPGTKAPAP